jgi:hypothetical protein
MGLITTTDGTQIYYKDCGAGQPVVFSHGWSPAPEGAEHLDQALRVRRRRRVELEAARGARTEDAVQDQGVEWTLTFTPLPKRWITVSIPVRPPPIPRRSASRA